MCTGNLKSILSQNIYQVDKICYLKFFRERTLSVCISIHSLKSEKREIILNTLVSLGNQISIMPLNR